MVQPSFATAMSSRTYGTSGSLLASLATPILHIASLISCCHEMRANGSSAIQVQVRTDVSEPCPSVPGLFEFQVFSCLTLEGYYHRIILVLRATETKGTDFV